MMTMKFSTEKAWHEACAAMVREGVTFEAYEIGMANAHAWVIEFTGGY